MPKHKYSITLDYRGGFHHVEHVLIQIEEQENNRGTTLTKSLEQSHLQSTSLVDSSNSHSFKDFKDLPTKELSSVKHSGLQNALFLSASYFLEDLETYNAEAFYTITTQGLAICELHNNVTYRLRLLHNLALYYYTKTAPQLRHLKTLEDVLELSPKQCSIATYYNNLAFMRLSAHILETDNREELQPLKNTTDTQGLAPVFTTTTIELMLTLKQTEQAIEENNAFAETSYLNSTIQNSTIQNAYFYLHNFLIYQADGNHCKAKENIELALQAFEQTEYHRTLAMCHHYLSELYENLGYYTQALEQIKLANRFEAKSKASNLNLTELERLHSQFRKNIVHRTFGHTLN